MYNYFLNRYIIFLNYANALYFKRHCHCWLSLMWKISWDFSMQFSMNGGNNELRENWKIWISSKEESIITFAYLLTIFGERQFVSSLLLTFPSEYYTGGLLLTLPKESSFLPSFPKIYHSTDGFTRTKLLAAAREMKFLWKLEKPMTGLILIAWSWTRGFPPSPFHSLSLSLTHSMIVYQLYLDRIRERNKENNLIFIDIIFLFIESRKKREKNKTVNINFLFCNDRNNMYSADLKWNKEINFHPFK